MITELCNDYQLQTAVDYNALAKFYRGSSEGYPATARDRPAADKTKKWSITIMGDSTWNWKVTTKIGTAKAQHEVTYLPRKINSLRVTKIPLDMPSTQIFCKGAFKCKNWLNVSRPSGDYRGGTEKARF